MGLHTSARTTLDVSGTLLLVTPSRHSTGKQTRRPTTTPGTPHSRQGTRASISRAVDLPTPGAFPLLNLSRAATGSLSSIAVIILGDARDYCAVCTVYNFWGKINSQCLCAWTPEGFACVEKGSALPRTVFEEPVAGTKTRMKESRNTWGLEKSIDRP